MVKKMDKILASALEIISIYQAVNGFILADNNNIRIFKVDDEDDFDDISNLITLHYYIDEVLGYSGTKHDKYRLKHEIQHGTNFECKDPNCKICNEKY